MTIRQTAAVLVLATSLAACSNSPSSLATSPSTPASTTVSTQTSTTGALASLTVSTQTARATGTGWSWSLSYPQVSGTTAATSINTALTTAARAGVTQFQAEATSPDGPSPTDDPDLAWTYEVTSETARPAPNLLVARLTTYTFTGGAHGGQILDVLTFDTTTGAELSLASLFQPASNFLERFADQAPDLLLTQFQNQGLSQDDVAQMAQGYAPTAENYATWEPTTDGIQITFAQYQLGAYALGMPQIVIPWATVRDIVAPGSPVARLTG
jgi:hypothetical protein